MQSIANAYYSSRSFIGSILDEIQTQTSKWSAIELASLLTVTLLLFYGFTGDNSRYLVQLIFLLSIISRKVLTSPITWFFLAALCTRETYNLWAHVPNHHFLTLYWVWVLCFAHFCQSPERQEKHLIFGAKFLVMLTMAGACLQKLISSSYMDGSFFEITLLTYEEFQFMLKLIGVSPELPSFTSTAVSDLMSPTTVVLNNTIHIPTTNLFIVFSAFVTYWNLSIQLLLEALCLLKGYKFQLAFHILFLFFIQTTYIVAPFVGFGFLICIWGFILAVNSFPRLAQLYLLSLLLMVAYDSPWRMVVS